MRREARSLDEFRRYLMSRDRTQEGTIVVIRAVEEIGGPAGARVLVEFLRTYWQGDSPQPLAPIVQAAEALERITGIPATMIEDWAGRHYQSKGTMEHDLVRWERWIADTSGREAVDLSGSGVVTL